jgi:acetyl esterase/lipase
VKKRYYVLLTLLVLIAAGAAFAVYWRGGCARYAEPTPSRYGVVRFDNLLYGEPFGNLEFQSLDVVAPVGVTQAPVVAILHGGGWTKGSRRIEAAQWLAEWLAARGVVGVPLGYRLVSPLTAATEQPKDVARGVAWLYQHISEYGGDPQRLFLLGHSAGGHLAALVTCDAHYLAEVNVPESAIAGVIALSVAFDVRESDGSGSLARRTLATAFGPDPAVRARLSPIAFVRPNLPPFLILRGAGDHLVSPEQATRMTEALRKAGNAVQFQTISGRDHVGLFHNLTQPGDLAAEAILAFALKHPGSIGR